MTLGRAGFWGYFRRDWDDVARRLLTRSGTLRPSIDAQRKDCSAIHDIEFILSTETIRSAHLVVVLHEVAR